MGSKGREDLDKACGGRRTATQEMEGVGCRKGKTWRATEMEAESVLEGQASGEHLYQGERFAEYHSYSTRRCRQCSA